MEVRDIWPESIKAVEAMKDNLFIRYFEWEERRCYNSARRIVVVTDSYKKMLTERGIDGNKIDVVKNGVSRDFFYPMAKDDGLIDELGLRGKRIIGYIGTHGMAHQLDFVLECAKSLENKDYHFLFIGDGAKKKELVELKERLGCRNVTMLSSVSREDVRRFISILDVALINMKNRPLFKTMIPYKMFENAAMGIPMLMGMGGEAKELMEKYHAGLCFEPGNRADFCEKLEMVLDPARHEGFREGGLRLAADFDRKVLAEKLLKIVDEALG